MCIICHLNFEYVRLYLFNIHWITSKWSILHKMARSFLIKFYTCSKRKLSPVYPELMHWGAPMLSPLSVLVTLRALPVIFIGDPWQCPISTVFSWTVWENGLFQALILNPGKERTSGYCGSLACVCLTQKHALDPCTSTCSNVGVCILGSIFTVILFQDGITNYHS